MGDVGVGTNGRRTRARRATPDTAEVANAAPLAYDLLTGLVSREVFDGQLARALERTWRTPGSVAVLLLRLRDLPLVNDRFGRLIGDELLAAAAARLRSCLREVDLVARLDGSTFAVVLEADRATRPDAIATDVASRLVSVFAEPLSTTLADLAVQASIGIAIADHAGVTADQLVDRAELAVAHAVQADCGFRFYEAVQHAEAVRRLQLKAALGHAIERDAFSLRYQPLVSLRTGATLGLEALLRWNDAEHGAVSPGDFIPVAEETDLIIPIGEWVLRTALEQRAAWAREIPGLPVIGLSVNVSARQMARPGLVHSVQRGLEDSGLPPEVLLLELTESVLMADDEVVRAQLKGLRDIGVRVGLDDFGTGWSSLEYLNRLPVDVLKIAQAFTDQIGTSTRATALVRAIIDLAHSLGLITVAEGVETEEQADRLRQMGCFLGQGWHFSRELEVPVASELLVALANPRRAGSGG
jgi:diguanylate cyclase (GGDEF)-like protein